MENLYRFSEPQLIAFALVLIRMSAFVMLWPVFGVESVPASLKVLFALVLSVLVFPVVDWQSVQTSLDSPMIIQLALREAVIGLMFGFLTRIFFHVLRMAGEVMSVSIGLSGAQLYNPAMGGMVTPLDQFLYAFGGLLFLAYDGHHLFLMGITDTFRILPLVKSDWNFSHLPHIAAIVQSSALAALALSAPIVIAIFLVNMAMGILGKTVPQINILITSLAVNAFVGIVMLLVSLPLMSTEMGHILERSAIQVFRFMRGF